MNNILLIGGLGFIGKNIIDVSGKKNKIIIAENKSNLKNYKNHKVYNCDISKISDLTFILEREKIDIIIFLATYYRPFHNEEDISNMIDVNVKGINNILELSLKYNIKKIINTGTCFEYGNRNEIFSENSKLIPWNLYANTKILAENVIDYYVEKGINVITLRLFPPFGLYDNKNKLVPYVIEKALSGLDIEVSPCEQEWDYIYSKDVAKAFDRALTYQAKGHEIFNVSYNKPVILKNLISKIVELTNSTSKIIFGAKNYRENEIMKLVGNNQKINEKMNLVFDYDTYSGIKETIEYFKRLKNGNN